MHTPFKGLLLLLGLAGLSLAAVAKPAADAPQELPEWHSRAGQSMRAEFLEVQYGEVWLRGTNNLVFKIPLVALTPEGQQLARDLEAQRQAGPAMQTQSVASNQLPVFLDGPAAQCNAIFNHKNFIATVDAEGEMKIVCLDQGKPIDKPLFINFGCSYSQPGKRRSYRRPVAYFDNPPKPSENSPELTYKGRMKDNVEFEITYEFKDNSIQAWGWIQDPDDISFPSRFGLGLRFTATHRFAPDVPLEERKKQLEGFELVVNPIDGKSVTYPFWQSTQRLALPAKRVEILGDVYGERRIYVTIPSTKIAQLHPRVYTGNAPHAGFSVGLRKSSYSSRNRNERLVLTID